MKTIVITGGASGLGLELTKLYITQNYQIIIIGYNSSSYEKLTTIINSTDMGQIQYIQADLSLISENYRIIDLINNYTQTIDKLILCSTKHHRSRNQTTEGIEATFALDYLSRYILTNELKELIVASDEKQIVSFCGVGYRGQVNFEDLQFEKEFKPMQVMMHGSRLNEIAAIQFTNDNPQVNYLLLNPGAVSTPGMLDFSSTKVKQFLYKLISKTPNVAANKLVKEIAKYSNPGLNAVSNNKSVDLSRSNKSYNQTIVLKAITDNLIYSKLS